MSHWLVSHRSVFKLLWLLEILHCCRLTVVCTMKICNANKCLITQFFDEFKIFNQTFFLTVSSVRIHTGCTMKKLIKPSKSPMWHWQCHMSERLLFTFEFILFMRKKLMMPAHIWVQIKTQRYSSSPTVRDVRNLCTHSNRKRIAMWWHIEDTEILVHFRSIQNALKFQLREYAITWQISFEDFLFQNVVCTVYVCEVL